MSAFIWCGREVQRWKLHWFWAVLSLLEFWPLFIKCDSLNFDQNDSEMNWNGPLCKYTCQPLFLSRYNLLGDDCAENIFVITARWLMQQNKGSHAACSIMNKHIYSLNYHRQLLRTLQNKICEKMFPQFSSFSLHHITATWRVHLEFPSTGGFNWGHWIKDFLVLIRGYSLPPPPNV